MSAKPAQPNIVLFSGGTACRTINIALAKRPYKLMRIVPAWDSGGSSKELRERFNMLPVGDIRQALMTMAHGEGRAGDVVKICNARLSEVGEARELLVEFEHFAGGAHPLLQRMDPEIAGAILNYLGLFRSRLPPDFDLRNGSIGNFILSGAYFAHGNNINRAIAVFRRLCGIEGNVWPVSVDNSIEETAVLKDGKRLAQQHLITRLDSHDGAVGIDHVALTAGLSGGSVAANPMALEAIASADAIIFGPGSFYTSILPHLLIDGIAEAVAGRDIAKIFIGNILECPETRGMALAEHVAIIGETLRLRATAKASFTHVLSNRELFPFEKTVGKFPYLKHGNLDAVCARENLVNVVGDFEDAWTRGQHDGEAVAAALASLLD